jgi:GNAT superfamily N-acetyltransferase
MPPCVAFAREPLTDALWDEALPLLVSHWQEVGHDEPLRPSLTRYGQLEAHGVLRVFTARVLSPVALAMLHDRSVVDLLVGYAMFTVIPSLNTGLLEAQQAAIYVRPEYRGAHGSAFIAYCEQELFSEGVELVYQTTTDAKDFGPLLERKGYRSAGHVWVKCKVHAARVETDMEALERLGCFV